MPKILSPTIAAAVAAALLGTTGYCVIQRGDPPAPPPLILYPEPAPVSPGLVLPYPPRDGP